MTTLIRRTLAAALLLAAGHATAGPLKVLGAQVDLPFDYKVRESGDTTFLSRGLHRSQDVELEITSGPNAGQVLEISTRYVAFERLPPADVERIVREAGKAQAERPGTRSTEDVKLDGFPFTLLAGKTKPGGERTERMVLAGSFNGAMYSISVFAKDVGPLDDALAASLRATKLDFPALLQARADFDAEASSAADKGWVDSPLGRLHLDAAINARMTSSGVRRDGEGRQVFRRRGFSLFKAGFITLQNVIVWVGCGGEDQAMYDAFLHMTEEVADEDPDDRYIRPTLPAPAQLATLSGETTSASGPTVPGGRRTDVTRLGARKDGQMYFAQVERINGGPIETALTRQLAAAAPACRVDMPYGAPPPREKTSSSNGPAVALRD